MRLPTVEDVERLDLADVPAMFREVAALQVALVLRLTMPPPSAPVAPEPDPDDVTSDVCEVAKLVRRSTSWVRKNGRRLPGFAQPGGKGTRVGWSRRALVAWATGTN